MLGEVRREAALPLVQRLAWVQTLAPAWIDALEADDDLVWMMEATRPASDFWAALPRRTTG